MGDSTKLIVLGVPFMVLLMALEGALNRRRLGHSGYKLADTVANIGCGVGQYALLVMFTTIEVVGYQFAYQKWALFDISSRSPVAWALAILASDLSYYVYHRTSHRMNALWAIHAVHHQSEEMNLSISFRLPWLLPAYKWIYYLPLAFVGVPPVMYLGSRTITFLYNFFIHTRVVGRLGWLEWFMNTPSHHRVHHGCDGKYTDKNYAGVFIVWDRLFGTFQAEEEEPTYGTSKPVGSRSAVWANVDSWKHVSELATKMPRLRDKLAVWFRPPEWAPPEASSGAKRGAATTRSTGGASVPPAVSLYVTMHLAFTTALTAALLMARPGTYPARGAIVVFIVASLAGLGALLDAKRWAGSFERARLLSALPLLAWLTAGTAALLPVTFVGGLVALASFAWLSILERGVRKPSWR